MKKIILIMSFIVGIFILSGCSKTNEQTITAVGSSSVQPLTESAGELYSKENKNAFINVQGGGTGTGLSQIQDGAVDIGNSDLFAEEKKGINAKKLIDYKIGVVAIIPIVNKDLNIDSLTMNQLQKIFSGQISNWKEVGGPDLQITLVNRSSGSGTRSVFEKMVMHGVLTKSAQEQDSSGMVRKIITNTPGSISYLAKPYLNKEVKSIKINNKKATFKNIINNEWPIWSYEHMYTQKNANDLTKKFIDYILSEKIQNEVVKKMGYVPVKDMHYQQTVDGKISKIK